MVINRTATLWGKTKKTTIKAKICKRCGRFHKTTARRQSVCFLCNNSRLVSASTHVKIGDTWLRKGAGFK